MNGEFFDLLASLSASTSHSRFGHGTTPVELPPHYTPTARLCPSGRRRFIAGPPRPRSRWTGSARPSALTTAPTPLPPRRAVTRRRRPTLHDRPGHRSAALVKYCLGTLISRQGRFFRRIRKGTPGTGRGIHPVILPSTFLRHFCRRCHVSQFTGDGVPDGAFCQ